MGDNITKFYNKLCLRTNGDHGRLADLTQGIVKMGIFGLLIEFIDRGKYGS